MNMIIWIWEEKNWEISRYLHNFYIFSAFLFTEYAISQDFIDGRCEYVTAALDTLPEVHYATRLCIPELNEHYGRQIPIQVKICFCFLLSLLFPHKNSR